MRALLRLAVVGCSLVLGLLAVEYVLLRGALHYHGIVDLQFFAFDEELGWKLQPEMDAVSSQLEFAVGVRTDAMGLRTSGHSDAWRSTPRRVLVAGDSFAFGWGVAGDQMFSARLQDALAMRGAPAAVLSAGVPGYSTDQEYLFWRRLAPEVRPDVTVLLISGNDPPADNLAAVSMYAGTYSKPFFRVSGGELEVHGVPVPRRQPLPVPPLESVKAPLRSLATYALMRHFNAALRAPQSPDGAPAAAPPADALVVTGAVLAAFNREVRASGRKLLVALIPSPAVRDGLATICLQEGIAFLDLGPTFAGRPDLVFKYDGHWNALGHQAAADAAIVQVAGLLQ